MDGLTEAWAEMLRKEEACQGMPKPSPVLTATPRLWYTRARSPYSQAVLGGPWHLGSQVALEDPAKKSRHDRLAP